MEFNLPKLQINRREFLLITILQLEVRGSGRQYIIAVDNSVFAVSSAQNETAGDQSVTHDIATGLCVDSFHLMLPNTLPKSRQTNLRLLQIQQSGISNISTFSKHWVSPN